MKLIQIFSLAGMLFLLIVTMCNTYNLQDIVCFAKDNPIDLHGHVNMDKDAGKYVGQGLNTIGSNIGLGASMAGIASAISKGIAKSSIPPLQKAGIIIAGAISGGFAHSIITTVNRKIYLMYMTIIYTQILINLSMTLHQVLYKHYCLI
jgi:hypothetical protein